ncbi:FG-GAP-like repeat-containing protein [Flexithrix dorotheae]|uniref:FG-GAP-like repeat-containing protein n=1 Tax=Flexithrix dorotheae TaxID=70993 RepID=UPI00146CFD51|nr:FG-GAP-like repeat-containing protein [Flexithrix dorotheae]
MNNNYYFQLVFTTLLFTTISSFSYSSIEHKINATRIEVENNFVVVTDEGTKSVIEADYDWIKDPNGEVAVKLWDAGDKLKMEFQVPEDGKYLIKVRLRSGESGDINRYWRENGYELSVNNNVFNFTGDQSSIIQYGTSYWGIMNSPELTLKATDNNEISIEAKAYWAGVDYIEIEKIEGNPPPPPSGDKIEFEDHFVAVIDGGGYPIEADPEWIRDPNGEIAVKLWDIGDQLKMTFNIPKSGKYKLKVRLRSGESGYKDRYWTENGYGISVNNTGISFSGVYNSIVQYGESYWGILESVELNLNAGNNEISVEAKAKWAGVDYLEIEEVEDNGEVKITIEDVPNQSSFVGDEVSLQLKASASNGGELVYESDDQISGFFNGLELNKETGLISGTVTKIYSDLFYPTEATLTVKVSLKDNPSIYENFIFNWKIDIHRVPSTSKYEMEDNYTTFKDVGTNGKVEIIGEAINNDGKGKAVALFDVGDRIHLGFKIPEDGKYQLIVRLRAGDKSSQTKYWPSGYSFSIDDVDLSFIGNNSSLSGLQNSLGGSYWGEMESPLLNLKAGEYYVEIEAESPWVAVDYLEIVKNDGTAQDLYKLQLLSGVSLENIQDAKWVDEDKDGDLDLFLARENSNEIEFYRNNSGHFNRSIINLNLESNFLVYNINLRDFDSDGDLDFLIYGSDNVPGFITSEINIFQNNGNGTYDEIPMFLNVYGNFEYNWVDSDQDGDLDIQGREHEIQYSQDFRLLYDKSENSFSNYPKRGVSGLGSWTDLNKDGLKDFLQHGYRFENGPFYFWTRLYMQGEFGIFKDLNKGFPDKLYGEWFDYDGDGDVDISSTTFFKNNGNENFSNSGIRTPVYPKSINGVSNILTTLDFNGDGHLDFFTKDGKLYINSSDKIKSKPQIPANLKANPNSHSVLLSWNDVRKEEEAYNLYIRKGNETIFTSESNRDTGYPQITKNHLKYEDYRSGLKESDPLRPKGNVGIAPIFKARELAPGTYHWSVQTVGSGQLASKFASEGSFTISNKDFPCSIDKVVLAETSCSNFGNILLQTVEIYFTNRPFGTLVVNNKELEVISNPMVVGFAPEPGEPIDLSVYFKENPECKYEIEDFILPQKCDDCFKNRVLTTQKEVDEFNCRVLEGNLYIDGTDITNLDALHILTSVKETLLIKNSPNLVSIEGLKNLTEVGNMEIHSNDQLTSLKGLENLQKITQLAINFNPLLSDCCILDKLKDFVSGNLIIKNNAFGCYSLENIQRECGLSPNFFQAEEHYQVLNDVGSNGTVKEFNEPIYKDGSGKGVSIFDVDDEFKIDFNVEENASYRLVVRLRAGGEVTNEAYWPNGYQFKLEGKEVKLVGDNTTLSEFSSYYGGAHWGDMISDTVNLEVGETYNLAIKSAKAYAAVDYLFVEKVGGVRSNRPPSELKLSQNEVGENEKINTEIGVFSGKDPDFFDQLEFSLVEGSNDNEKFAIDENKLITREIFDFEQNQSFTIRVKVSDKKGGVLAENFTINVKDVFENSSPTAVALSGNTIKENLPIGSIVGELSTIDPDTFQVHQFEIRGGLDSTKFVIDNNLLKTKTVFDFETQEFLKVIVLAKDEYGAFVKQEFTIQVLDEEEAPENQLPTDILIDNSGIEEEQAPGALIGVLSADDPDIEDSHTFEFADGEGALDNDKFQIEGDQLRSAKVFDFETQKTFSLRIKVTDNNEGEFEKIIIVTVIDKEESVENSSPTDILLSNNNIKENVLPGSNIGDLTGIDTDSADVLSFGLALNGEGSEDNGSFIIENGQLKNAVIFDFEEKKSYQIRIQVSDGNGGSFEKVFSINIEDVEETIGNNLPTDILISNIIINENEGKGAFLGKLSVEDLDSLDSHQFSVLADFGGDQLFEAKGDSLFTKINFDFEEKESHKIKVAVSDGNGGVFHKEFVILVSDVDESPANRNPDDIKLSNVNLVENAPVGTLVGKLTSSDPDEFDNHTFYLIEGEGDDDNGKFFIIGNEIFSGGIFRYTEQKVFSVRIEAQDGNGGSYQEAFSIFLTQTEVGYSIGGILFQKNGERVKHAKVVLYQEQEDGKFQNFTSQEIVESDLYVFTDVPQGRYFIKAIPDKKVFPNLLDTYFGDVIIRADANKVTLSSDSLNQNIIIQQMAAVVGGNSSIKGKVVASSNFSGGRIVSGNAEGDPLPNVRLYILQLNINEVIAETYSDEEGNFVFEGLAINEYRVLADYQGIPLDLGSLSLGIDKSNEEKEVTVIVGNEKIIIENKSVTGLEDEISLEGISVFPNPVKNEFSILLKNQINGSYSLVIYDVLGKILDQQVFEKNSQDFRKVLNLENLQQGLYILTISTGTYSYKTRIIKENQSF